MSLLLLCLTISLVAEMPMARELSAEATAQKITPAVMAQFGVTFQIVKTYQCSDMAGIAYLVLTESRDRVANDEQALNSSIRAFYLLEKNGTLTKRWEAKDFCIKQADSVESDIGFWTEYLSLADLDADGLIDPIVVYGSSGINGTSDGRIKILIYYRGRKFAIRHQNGVLDFQRYTQIDAVFYNLPSSMQARVKELMQKMTTDGHAIFPVDWENGMAARKTKLVD